MQAKLVEKAFLYGSTNRCGDDYTAEQTKTSFPFPHILIQH
jgi:hypothetical protein